MNFFTALINIRLKNNVAMMRIFWLNLGPIYSMYYKHYVLILIVIFPFIQCVDTTDENCKCFNWQQFVRTCVYYNIIHMSSYKPCFVFLCMYAISNFFFYSQMILILVFFKLWNTIIRLLGSQVTSNLHWGVLAYKGI